MSLRARLRSDEGFTLIELLTAMSIGVVVLFAATTVLQQVVLASNNISDRVDTVQRGRVAMDVITRELRSQVCSSASDYPIIDGTSTATDSSVRFYADLSSAVGTGAPPVQPIPERRTLSYSATAKTITETVETKASATAAYVQQTQRTLLTNVVPVTTTAGTVTPVLQFFAYGTTTPPQPDVLLGSPLVTATTARTVARIVITFVVQPQRTNRASNGTAKLQDEVFVRAVDPTSANPAPQCF